MTKNARKSRNRKDLAKRLRVSTVTGFPYCCGAIILADFSPNGGRISLHDAIVNSSIGEGERQAFIAITSHRQSRAENALRTNGSKFVNPGTGNRLTVWIRAPKAYT